MMQINMIPENLCFIDLDNEEATASVLHTLAEAINTIRPVQPVPAEEQAVSLG